LKQRFPPGIRARRLARTQREWLALLVASTLSVIALSTFVLVRLAFAQLPFANPIHPGGVKALPVVAFVAALGSSAVVFGRSRAPLDLAVLCLDDDHARVGGSDPGVTRHSLFSGWISTTGAHAATGRV